MIRFLFLSLVAFSLSWNASASPETETLVRRVAAQMEKRTGEDLAQIVVNEINVSKMAGYVLGEYGRDLPTADRVAFESRFEAFLVSVIAERAWNLSDSDLSVIGSVDRRNRESIVTMRIKERAEPSRIMRWRLMRTDNGWETIDIQLGGMWLAIEQRAQVDIAMSYDGVEIEDLYDTSNGGQDALLSASTRNSGGGRRVVEFLDRVLP